MADSSADRNLLCGVLALQMDFVGRDALIAAMNAWAIRKATPLEEILLEQQAITAEEGDILSNVVRQHLRKHRGDARESLVALGRRGAVPEALRQAPDADVHASLVHLATQVESPTATDATLLAPDHSTGSIDDRFEILRTHAAGALGEVFVAHDHQLNRQVALKCIHQRHLPNADSRTRFLLEAEITGGLEHPGIVPVYGMGVTGDGRPYYAMRLIRGETLKQAIARFHKQDGRSEADRRLELRQLLGRFISVCNAVEYAHSRGVVHRDLKPSNIMLGKFGETLVVDWGLVKALHRRDGAAEPHDETLVPISTSGSSETLPGSAIGTPSFMSPEQAAGRTELIGPASDIYSLGATLYALLTGGEPFAGDDVGKVLQAVQAGDFPRPRERNRSVPPALEAICLKAMQPAPASRYASCTALARDIEHCLAEEPVDVYRDSPLVRSARWMKRHRGWTTTAMALAACVFVGLVVRNFVLARVNSQIAAHAASEERQRAEATRQLYVSQMNLAQRAWDENNVGRVRELLATQTPDKTGDVDLRGWEWHYLQRLANSELETIDFEGVSVAIASDGLLFAAGGLDGTLRLWKSGEAEAARVIAAHSDRINRVLFTPDRTHLLTGGRDGTVKMWNIDDLKMVRSFPVRPSKSCQMMALSPDGTQLAVGVNEIAIYSLPDGTLQHQFIAHTDFVPALTFTPDGERLVTGSWDGTVRIWDRATAGLLRTLNSQFGHVHAVAISRDGGTLFAGGRTGEIVVWNIETGEEQRRIHAHANKVNELVVCPDLLRLVSISDDATIKFWNIADGAELQTLRGHESGVNGIAVAPNGERVLTSSWDSTVRHWDTYSRQEPLLDPSIQGIISVSFDRDGGCLAIAAPSFIKVMDAATLRELWSGAENISGYVGEGEFMTVPKYAVSVDPRGRWLAVAQPDGQVRVRDARSGRHVRNIAAHTGAVASVVFSPDGNSLATTGADSTAALWNVSDGRQLHRLEGHTRIPMCAAFSPDGTLLATGAEESRDERSDMSVRLWNTTTGEHLRTLTGHEGGIFTVVFSRDGRRLFSGSRDETIREWDVATGRDLRVFHGHAGSVTGLAMSPDGRRLASSGTDDTLRLWDLATGQQVQTLRLGNRDIAPMPDFSADGQQIAVGSIAGLYVWDAQPLAQVRRRHTESPGHRVPTP